MDYAEVVAAGDADAFAAPVAAACPDPEAILWTAWQAVTTAAAQADDPTRDHLMSATLHGRTFASRLGEPPGPADPGFSVPRWIIWRSRLEGLARSKNPVAVEGFRLIKRHDTKLAARFWRASALASLQWTNFGRPPDATSPWPTASRVSAAVAQTPTTTMQAFGSPGPR